MKFSLSRKVRHLVAAGALSLGLGAGALGTAAIVAPQTAFAATTTCRTIYLSHTWWQGIALVKAYLYVPVCWNGSTVWQNGNITPGITLISWSSPGVTWKGTYDDSSRHWLGMGENFTATLGLPHVGASTTFTPRWYINASGVVYAFGSS
jgi:hypothetical protein